MLKNITPAQITLIEYAALGLAAWWVYSKVTSLGKEAAEVAQTKLNPMSRENLINQAAENIVGEDRLYNAAEGVFDTIDSIAEFFGSETGINGIKGTNAEQGARLRQGGPRPGPDIPIFNQVAQ